MSVSTHVSILHNSSKNKSTSTKITTVRVVFEERVFEIFDSSGTWNCPSSSEKSSLSTASISFSSISELEALSSPYSSFLAG
jgi:hypothetical protein